MIFCEYWVAGKSPNWDGKESARTPTSHYTQYTLLVFVSKCWIPHGWWKKNPQPFAASSPISWLMISLKTTRGLQKVWKFGWGSIFMLPELDHVRLLKVLWEKEMCLWGAKKHSLGWWTRPWGNRWIKNKVVLHPIGSMYGIYVNIGGILMGSMLPYIAAPWILWVLGSIFV